MNQPLAMSEASPLLGVLRRQQVIAVLRAATFVGSLLVAWISLRPFIDLAELDLADASTGNDTMTYAVFGGLALLVGALTIPGNRRGLATLLSARFLIIGGRRIINDEMSTATAVY